MVKTISFVRRDEVLAVFVKAYDDGFMAGLHGYDSSQAPTFENDTCRSMWFQGWDLAKQLLMDREV